jgi:tRNA 2-thiocytidine biosynthesis protein TtcA
MRFARLAGQGINKFSMFGPGERILIGVSGGKDSLALALALSLRKRWVPIDYELTAVKIDWEEYPVTEEERDALIRYFQALAIPFRFIRTPMFASSFKGRFDCYLCSRNRKRILFEEMERRGITTLALGHNLDDIAETTLINMSCRGSFATMMPVQTFFNGKIRLIRPLCMVRENNVRNISNYLELPVTDTPCPYKDTNIRAEIKPLISRLSRLNKQARENIFRSTWNIDRDYLPDPPK